MNYNETPIELQLKIVSMANDLMHPQEVADELGVSFSCVHAVLKRNGVSARDLQKKRRKKDDQVVIDMYESGMNFRDIEKAGICSKLSCHNIMKRNCVETRKRKNHFDMSYWDKLDHQDKYYILGLWYADGYCFDGKHGGGISLSLVHGDKRIIHEIKQRLGYTGPIDILKRPKENEQDHRRLRIQSKYLYKRFEDFGLYQKKSLTLQRPTFVPDDMLPHFVRGLMDGDGSLMITKTPHTLSTGEKKVYLGFALSFTGSNDMIIGFMDTMKRLGMPWKANIPKNGGRYSEARTQGKDASMKFLDWMYNDSILKMHRKYMKYLDMVEIIQGKMEE